jgi:hypothetical protein
VAPDVQSPKVAAVLAQNFRKSLRDTPRRVRYE